MSFEPVPLRVVAIADTHLLHDDIELPDGDVLVHAGDVSGRGRLHELETFARWFEQQPHPHKLIIAGNHDFGLERPAERDDARALLSGVTYLEDAGVTIEGVHFWGSPWQPEFGGWAFNLPRGRVIRDKWELIPPDTDVLITHGPPAGHGDLCFHGGRAGCHDLLEVVERIGPRYHIFGHIHEGYGGTRNERTTFLNASVCDAMYRPVNRPLVFDIEAKASAAESVRDGG